ncbi:MAG: ABC transporter ATP-binding protein [Kofleriaceae bacterium]|nr:ABC transporter ATP-binding protein [Kofleriaceae bacterium]
MNLAIDVDRVTKTFGTGALAFTALREVSFRASQGEIVMLVGPSGSGKTTLLSIIGCVLSPTSGRVELFGTEVSGRRERQLPEIRRALIGFVFQGHNLISSLSVRDNVRLVLETRGVTRRQATRRAEALIERVGLTAKLDALPAQLSGGQRQRVAIARAAAGDPPLLLADEPTAALDANSGKAVTELLAELSRERGTTVVIVTHDPRIYDLGDRIVHLEDGAIVQATRAA